MASSAEASSSSTRTRKRTIAHYFPRVDSDSEVEIVEAKRKKVTKRKRTKRSDTEDELEEKPVAASQQGKLTAHAASRHVIKDPKPLRLALLNWYAGVHEARGMPWRKVYDSTLSAAGRSQRAYEVNYWR